jgi:hypothetical protein
VSNEEGFDALDVFKIERNGNIASKPVRCCVKVGEESSKIKSLQLSDSLLSLVF